MKCFFILQSLFLINFKYVHLLKLNIYGGSSYDIYEQIIKSVDVHSFVKICNEFQTQFMFYIIINTNDVIF